MSEVKLYIVPESGDGLWYGTPRHSGRYPWGSGKNPYQSLMSFQKRVYQMRKEGKSDKEIRKSFDNMSTGKFVARMQAAKDAQWKYNAKVVRRMSEAGVAGRAISRKTGIPEATVRQYLKSNSQTEANRYKSGDLADTLRANVDKLGFVDVGKGVASILSTPENPVTDARMKSVLAQLEESGYKVYSDVNFKQSGTRQWTPMKVLVKDDVSKGDVVRAILDAKVGLPSKEPGSTEGVVHDEDGRVVSKGPVAPASIDSKRIFIKYNEEGGLEKDGLIEIRRGVPDLDLGKAHYAQVRIAVNSDENANGLYIKGMAAYSDDVPAGYDILVNSNKHVGAPLDKVLKPMTGDPANPFKASIKGEDRLIKFQKYYTDPETGEKKLSAINVVNEEGDWDTWSRNLSSQFLSKQSTGLIHDQLKEAYDIKKSEFDEIMSIKNPTIRKEFLSEFADSCDSSSWKLKGAPLPGQATQVLLPLTTLKEGTVYAPRYPDGTEMVLVRFPFAATFESPRVRNDLSNAEGKKLIGTESVEAIGVSPRTRMQMSGADCDGDTVLAIPDPDHRISTRPFQQALIDFQNEIDKFENPPGKLETKNNPKFKKGFEMGSVSNLITDMTLRGAPDEHIIRAIKHSMVVIDAQKHNYDWEASEKEFGIRELKKLYQGGEKAGASTLISRRKTKEYVGERKDGNYIYDPETGRSKKQYVDPETGEKLYRETGRTYRKVRPIIDPETKEPIKDPVTGKVKYEEYGKDVVATTKVYKMLNTDDAYTLTSGGSKKNPGTQREAIYAEAANAYKRLGNEARKESEAISEVSQDKAAAKEYAVEVASIKAKILEAKKNKPFERQAQMLAKVYYENGKDDARTEEEDRKLQARSLMRARDEVGSKKKYVVLTDREREAVEKNALPHTVVHELYKESNKDKLKSTFMPRDADPIPAVKVAWARSAIRSGNSIGEVAEQLDVSPSTLSKLLNGESK